jgi:hypothetical protein
MIAVISIAAVAAPAPPTPARGRYRVTLDADGRQQELVYNVALSPQEQSVSWQPPDSILSDPRIDVLVVAAVTDLVVAFHRGEAIEFPRTVSPRPVGPDTAVIRL